MRMLPGGRGGYDMKLKWVVALVCAPGLASAADGQMVRHIEKQRQLHIETPLAAAGKPAAIVAASARDASLAGQVVARVRQLAGIQLRIVDDVKVTDETFGDCTSSSLAISLATGSPSGYTRAGGRSRLHYLGIAEDMIATGRLSRVMCSHGPRSVRSATTLSFGGQRAGGMAERSSSSRRR
jgi:hypothetical protein